MKASPQIPKISISVVVPAFNAETFIVDALQSVASQTYKPFEIFVIDDGSLDDTAKAVRNWKEKNPDVELIFLTQSNSGISATRNRGIALARGDWIAFLDADDIWERDHLHALIEAGTAVPSAVATYGAGRLFTAQGINDNPYDNFWDNPSKTYGSRIPGTPILQIDKQIFPRLLKGNFIKPSALMVKRSALKAVGAFNQIISTAEDREFLLRLILHGDFAYTERIISRYRWHENNASQSKHSLRNAFNGLHAIQLILKNLDLKLSKIHINECRVHGKIAAREYLYLCSSKGLLTYVKGLFKLKKLSGIGFTLICMKPKDVLRSIRFSF